MSKSPTIEQGISGTVEEASGNRMPLKGAPPSVPRPLQTTVFIYEATNISQVTRTGTSPFYTAIRTKMVASVHSDSTGAFLVALPPGNYSVFVKLGDAYYANSFDAANNISLFTVEQGKLAKARITIGTNAVY